MTRHVWLLLHRYAGLAMAVFLLVVGLTGSVLVFVDELEAIVSPQLFPPVRSGTPLDAATLAERAEALAPQALADSVYFGHPGTVLVWMSARTSLETNKPFDLTFNQLFLDPITGLELGRRQTGSGLPRGWGDALPFIYRLHYNLSLELVGMWVLGITAVVWTFDNFIGFYLTLPTARRKPTSSILLVRPTQSTPSTRNYWQRWKPAWWVRWRVSNFRTNFDLHRAGGLWLWLALLVFAWSAVYMNLHDQVYAPVTRLVFDYPKQYWELPTLPEAQKRPAISWQELKTKLNPAMQLQAQQHGFAVVRPVSLGMDRERGLFLYTVHSNLDFQDKRGRTVLVIDATTGDLKELILPSGQHSGVTVTNWLATLHEANVFGLPYRIFVCLLGLCIVMLSVTGVYIWLKKRRGRRVSRSHVYAETAAAKGDHA